MTLRSWYERPKLAFFVFAAVTVCLIACALRIEIGESYDGRYTVFSVEFDYYGVDADKIERLITIPLEEKILPLAGLVELDSSAENGKSTTTAYFNKKVDAKNVYLSIGNVVNTLYALLPRDVQKPRIYASDAHSGSVLCVAFEKKDERTRETIESALKKKIESVRGVSEAIVTGGAQNEVFVSFDPEKASSAMQNPSDFSAAVRDGNTASPACTIRTSRYNKLIVFDTKLKNLDDLRALPIKTGENYSTLGYVADIEMRPRKQDGIVRIDGKECIALNVKCSSDGNSIAVSSACKKILSAADLQGIPYTILYDTGGEQLKLIRSVAFAFVQSFICVAVIVPFFYESFSAAVLILLLLIADSVWTVGLLQLFGFTLNRRTIAGMSIALGLIADSALIIVACAETSPSNGVFFDRVGRLHASLTAAGCTTLLAVIPLFFLDAVVPGTKNTAAAMSIMISASVVLSAVFVPCCIRYGSQAKRKRKPYKKIESLYVRFSYWAASSSIAHGRAVFVLYACCAALPPLLFLMSGKNLLSDEKSRIIFASVDYEPETSAAYIDENVRRFALRLKEDSGVSFVRTEAKRGSADIEIGCVREADVGRVRKIAASSAHIVPDGFLYVPGLQKKKRKKFARFRIAASGDDSTQCRIYAERAAAALAPLKHIDSVVLNFKKAEKEYAFVPDKAMLIKNGLTVESVASNLRWLMFGPVADKWLQDGREYDIRIAGKNLQNASLSQIQNIHLPVPSGSISLTALGEIRQAEKINKIYRKDGRRCAYFTAETSGLSTSEAAAFVRDRLAEIPLEKGYGFSFERDIAELRADYTLAVSALVLCVAGIFILLAALNERLKFAALIVSVIPASFVLPLAIRFASGVPLELGDLTGMVVLSGITVNNAIYITESKKSRIEFCIREKARSILVTSFTTAAGAVPLYLFGGDPFSRGLSFFMIFGIVDALVVSFVLFPGCMARSLKKSHFGGMV